MNAQSTRNCIAAAVDLSETGDHALREAMRLARQLPGSELHVVYVVRSDKGLHSARKIEDLSHELRDKLEEVRAHVTTVCAPAAGAAAFTQETVIHVRLGDPAEAIHQAAVDVNADLIVVGTHGRKGVEKLILGSVAEQLIRIARVPVVVAHPKDFGDLHKSEHPDPRRPGQDIHSTGVSSHLHLEFRPRTSHISGLV